MGIVCSRRRQEEPRNKIKILEKIGEGSYGQVYKVKYKNNIACAKFYKDKFSMKEEVKMLKIAQKSGFVPKFIKSFANKEEQAVIMELLPGKTLEDFVMENRLSAEQMHKLMYMVGTAIMKLHSTGIIHNDLKMDNIIVFKETDKCSVFIIDLGLAMYEGESPYPGCTLESILQYP